ncbi:MAG: apolipoprotein N-acyltransferase, partial [Geminicoccaceae bacterium]|nr:apolipoprotein N-acyltransferase [Geminicoccaceae bacterium]
NTGISAVIDPLGRIERLLRLNQMGVIDGGLPRALEPTVFARFGHLGAVLLALLLGGGAGVLEWYASGGRQKVNKR